MNVPMDVATIVAATSACALSYFLGYRLAEVVSRWWP